MSHRNVFTHGDLCHNIMVGSERVHWETAGWDAGFCKLIALNSTPRPPSSKWMQQIYEWSCSLCALTEDSFCYL